MLKRFGHSILRGLRIVRYKGFVTTIGFVADSVFKRSWNLWKSKFGYLRIRGFFRLGYFMNFKNPASFNEQINIRKFSSELEVFARYADKFLVRDILKNKGYAYLLNDLVSVYKKEDEFLIENLPDDVVIKANYGSGMNILKPKISASQYPEVNKQVRSWFNGNYNQRVYGTEFHYELISPQVIVEKFLRNTDESPLLDYKFYCFHGKVEFVDLIDNSHGIPLMYVYDKNWKQMDFTLYNKPVIGRFPKPEVLNEMVRIAEDLSTEFDFVRIDLYLLDNKRIVFGEYTFFPGGGLLKFNPKRMDKHYGEILKSDS
jgi:hypothetical protein